MRKVMLLNANISDLLIQILILLVFGLVTMDIAIPYLEINDNLKIRISKKIKIFPIFFMHILFKLILSPSLSYIAFKNLY